MNTDFELLKQKAIEAIGKSRTMVLSTCSDNRVTSRSMSCINDGLKILFQTSSETMKYKQIIKNPNVSLCSGNMTIEGTARILNHPLKEDKFIKRFKAVHKGSYNAYSFMRSEVVIEVTPKLITFWNYTDEKPYQDFLNLETESATRQMYDTSDRI